MRWVVVLVLFTACGRVGFDGAGDDTSSDGAMSDGATTTPDACSFGPWGTPQPIAAVNTPAGEEWSPTLSDDGLELVFQRGGGGPQQPQPDLFVATRATTADSFGAEAPLTAINTTNPETSPWLSDDRRTLYFSTTGSVYRATRPGTQGTFGTPQAVPGLEALVVRGATLSSDQKEILYNDNNNDRIYRATYDEQVGGFVVVGALAELGTNSSGFPDLARDGLGVLLERSGNLILEARRSAPGATFSIPAVITALDSSSQDGDPDLGDHDRAIVFASTRAGTLHDIYIATRSCQ